MLLRSHLLLAILWMAFCGLHSLLAADSIKQKIIPRLPKGIAVYRLWYTLFAAAGFVAVVLYQVSMHSIWLFRPGGLVLAAGIAGCLCGVTVMVICIVRYFMQLSGLQGLVKKNNTPVLLQNGLHGHVRHPLYMGTFIFIWSLWLVFPLLSLCISNIIITIYTIIGARLEEKKLERVFGADYTNYRKETPMFIPRFFTSR
jgi:protein-S-isoprenylcysteine O-methyltransferase Ste14